MRKGLIVLLVAVVAVAFAMPVSAADFTTSGFLRQKAYVSNFNGEGALYFNEDASTNAFVEQRFRMKFDFGNENVKAVWYVETDFNFGDSAGGSGGSAVRNQGGALGGDKINLETKNIYTWFKIPDTSMAVTVGLQNQNDDYAGIVYGYADMAGIFLTGKYEPASYKLGWAKLYENATHESDDMTLYYAATNFVSGKDLKWGLNFYFLQNDTNKTTGTLPGNNRLAYLNDEKVYMLGGNVAAKAGPATISGFLQFQTGKFEATNPGDRDVDISAFTIDLRADMNVGPGKAFFEGLYLSGGDNTADKYKAPIDLSTNNASPGGNSSYTRANSYLMLASPDTLGTISQCFIGCSAPVTDQSLGNQGRGMWMLAAGYAQDLNPKTKIQGNIIYLNATEMLKSDNSNRKENMGTELNARLDYNIYKGLDVGLVGAYVFIGDFYKNSAGQTAKDIYTTYARLNYAF
ncbi:MAG: hypothetical protein E4G97_03525 [Deltaproteobacteria bacterium]|nr:MAG: hypothetical protein E4G97_03525 [Deltaproteobacteria bacterium]